MTLHGTHLNIVLDFETGRVGERVPRIVDYVERQEAGLEVDHHNLLVADLVLDLQSVQVAGRVAGLQSHPAAVEIGLEAAGRIRLVADSLVGVFVGIALRIAVRIALDIAAAGIVGGEVVGTAADIAAAEAVGSPGQRGLETGPGRDLEILPVVPFHTLLHVDTPLLPSALHDGDGGGGSFW